jgi:subtilase family serine protease
MNKTGLVGALIGGLMTAACSSHTGTSPLTPQGQTTQATAPSTMGAHTTRAASLGVAPLGWGNTATQTFNLTSASDMGALPATQALTVRLGLQMRNADQLKSLVASRQRINRGTFLSTYAPTSDQVGAVTTYLSSQGFKNVKVEPDNLLISADGTADIASKAFNTNLHSFSQRGLNVFANTSPAYVPQSLSGIVVAVLGLNNVPAYTVAPKLTAKASSGSTQAGQPTPCNVEGENTPSQACLRFYDPTTFNIAYDAGNTPTGSSTTLAIMASYSVDQSISDFRLNEQQFGLPTVPLKVMTVGIPNPTVNSAATGEWTLDMTYSSAMAGNLQQILLYDTPTLADSDIALEYSRWVTDDLAQIGNSSFGGCEYAPFIDGSMLVDDMILLEGAAQGQTMFASTGDSGGFCGVGVPNGVPAGAPLVEYPAASQYVVAVGGTDLFSFSDGTYKGENAWEAGGGGLSQFEGAPYWEASQQPVAQQGQNFRGLPDVAFDAAIETGALLWGGQATNGACTPCITGGTSLASPIAAGIWARMVTAHGAGFAPPILYSIYSASPAKAITVGPGVVQAVGPFHDIVTGSNVTYQAMPGYDYTTGLGSLDISLLNSAVGP